MYIAVTYLGGLYTPGEIIREDVPEETLKWWIRKGAVKEVKAEAAPEKGTSSAPAGHLPIKGKAGDDLIRQPAADTFCSACEQPTGAERRGCSSPTGEGSQGEGNEPEFDDEEAPEIDVMDGVVPAAEKKPAKPARKKAKKGGAAE